MFIRISVIGAERKTEFEASTFLAESTVEKNLQLTFDEEVTVNSDDISASTYSLVNAMRGQADKAEINQYAKDLAKKILQLESQFENFKREDFIAYDLHFEARNDGAVHYSRILNGIARNGGTFWPQHQTTSIR